MKGRDVRKFLFDILQAARLLEDFVADVSLDQYEGNAMLRSAVERQFQIIGEALVLTLRASPDLGARISHTREIIAFRNILVHAYADIAHEIVWSAVRQDLPVLQQEVQNLLAELNGTKG